MDRFGSLAAKASEHLISEYGLQPVVAAELEFYLSEDVADNFWNEFSERCTRASVKTFKTEKERGNGQYEVALYPADAVACVEQINKVKDIIAGLARDHQLQANFSAKPYADQPGSGLHIHLHLSDASGANVFFKNDARISDPLKHSIGGLLAWLPISMPVFAPNEDSYKRFVSDDNTPLTISWGANNRTVAVRLPDADHDNKRIEHRVPCADADPDKAIAIILMAMCDGIKNQIDPGEQMYGDANLPMYDKRHFPQSLAEARSQMQQSDKLNASDFL